ncbi:unnamed protein product [Caenorhabditis bovis]|uniref:CHK kinase-like domain-containing protein n=1 Tax=Caenorhabditis bovis TaxID=2654633 RepID=A0A8S1EE87_9PELO|nr:unnamed protein product [Caenorhabditis bovis]
MSEFIIENVPLTKQWLADVIEKKTGFRPKIGTSTTLDNAELGYMSLIRKVGLIFDDNALETKANLPKNVVLKIANGSKLNGVIESATGNTGVSNETMLMETFMHNTECAYYNLFANEEKPLKIPTIYATEDSRTGATPIPVIVMELYENCKIYDICQGFNESQLYKIVDELVKLHIYSLTTTKWKLIKADPFLKETAPMFFETVKSISNNLSQQPELDVLKVFNRNTFEKNPQIMSTFSDVYENGERTAVIAHGDLWAPQILWDQNDDIAGIVDWQIAHHGSPLEDFLRVMSTCTTVENRKKLTKPLLDYYHEQLSKGLEAKGVKIPYTREELDEEYKYTMIHVGAMTIFANGFWANSPVLQTDGKPDPEKIAESFGRCRSFIEDVIAAHNME